ncbi:hypothetical protein HYS50_02610 [Candidatus Woesearchaeota archaeon]|nr:hypothetical protein [Candidatus Woesearchaeota archaeon]
MVKSFLPILGAIFGGLAAFTAINGLLYNLGNMQRWDYILANAFVIILIYFAYLTYEIQKIKERVGAK